ncbi:MAG: hypothetical protein ACI8PZ_004052 [Myxococcota bacterium]|jgi:hypothetical protein
MSSPVEARRAALLELASDAGIRLKNVPEHPSASWLDKAHRRVKEAIAVRDARVRARRDSLVEHATSSGIRLRNVPELPTEAWLDKAKAKVDAAIAKRAAARMARDAESPRLASLLARARALGVRIRKVPSAPSESWLDRLDQKLTEIARSRTLPVPPDPTATPVRAEERMDPSATMDGLAPATGAVPSAIDSEAVEQQAIGARVAELIRRADRAGLDVGRVPPNPSEEWVVTTAAALEDVLEQRREARRAERSRKASRRKDRMRALLDLVGAAGVDIGTIPPFPTEDWIARAELKVHERLYAHEDEDTRRNRLFDQRRRERLTSLMERAQRGGFDVGSIPPDPDEEWLTKAEQRVQFREAEASEVLEAGSSTLESTPRLVYEEDTLQEEVKHLEGTEATIGRNRTNEIQVRNDAQVSRRHARLWEVDGIWYIADLGSTRGTQVNGETLTGDHELMDGDEVQTGETRFVFRA